MVFFCLQVVGSRLIRGKLLQLVNFPDKLELLFSFESMCKLKTCDFNTAKLFFMKQACHNGDVN